MTEIPALRVLAVQQEQELLPDGHHTLPSPSDLLQRSRSCFPSIREHL